MAIARGARTRAPAIATIRAGSGSIARPTTAAIDPARRGASTGRGSNRATRRAFATGGYADPGRVHLKVDTTDYVLSSCSRINSESLSCNPPDAQRSHSEITTI